MNLKVLLVDDEELARLRLRGLLRDSAHPAVEVVGEATNAAEALRWISRNSCDLVLLDVHMPGVGGLELAERLSQMPRRPAVVFTTAHPEHALHAFALDAVDYLPKPIRRSRLHEALVRAAARLGQPPPAPRPSDPDGPALVVHTRGSIERIPLCDIIYLRAELKYVTVRTAYSNVTVDETLYELSDRLGSQFVRIHRNAVVACRAVRSLERRADAGDEDLDGWAVRVAPTEEWLPVSRRQLALVRQALSQAGL